MGWQDDPVVSGAPAGGGWQGDPVVGGAKVAAPAQSQHGALYNALFKEATPGQGLGASADEGVVPALRDYGLAALDDVTLGLGVPNALKAATARAQQNLGPMSYVTGAAAYGAGPGKFLAPLAKGIAGAGIAGAATEGAMAGGISGAAHGEGNPLYDATKGALGGAVLGGAGGAVGKVFTKGAPAIDPEAVAAQATATKEAGYGGVTQYPIHPDHVDQGISQVINNLDPAVKTGLSNGFKATYKDIQQTAQEQGVLGQPLNAEQAVRWKAQLKRDASTPEDKVTSQQFGGMFDGLLANAGAADAAQAANTAYKRMMNAQALQELQTPFAGNPVTIARQQAANYEPGDPEYQAWQQIAEAAKKGIDPSYMAAHLGGDIAETVGLHVAGPVGMFIGKGLGYLGSKALSKKFMASRQGNALLRAYQQQSPALTGVAAPPAPPSQTGDMIKNLMLGTAY